MFLIVFTLFGSCCVRASEPVSISSLDLSHLKQGWGKPGVDRSVDGNALSIGGRKFDRGIGTHAGSDVAIRLDGKPGRFTAMVGADDEVAPKVGTVEFRALADGREVWTSGVMKTGDAARKVDLPLAGVRQLALLVTDGGDGNGNDHADWAEAAISGESAVVATEPFVIAKHFPKPGRIRYDGHCFQIENRDTFVYCATFHYFRTPKELWRDRFRKIKEAGFNTVETYTPWNWHERQMPAGLTDFSKVDLSELEAWLKMAHEEFGLYTVVRPGPFICAEWAGGGYPRWLAKFGPGTGDLWLRGADETHIAWCVHWYDAVCKLFAREQLTAKPTGAKGIIMVQIENEYDAHGTGGKDRFLTALQDSVRRAGVEVPVFTCLTRECRGSKDPKLSQVFDCDNYYVGLKEAAGCAHRMAALRRSQPDAPGFVTELQGGWFSTIGGSLSEDHYSDARHSNAIHWMSLLGGATGLTPYVFVGGTHFGNWGSRGQTTSYDYNAAIRESGACQDKYLAARGVARFIHENEAALVRSEGGPCDLQGAPKSIFGGVRVAPDGTRFVFLLNNDTGSPFSGKITLNPGQIAKPAGPIYNYDQNNQKVLIDVAGGGPNQSVKIEPFEVQCDIGPLGAGVLVIPPGKTAGQGTWYPKAEKPIARPASLPAPVRLSKILRRDEDFDVKWQPLPAAASLPEMDVGDQRYVLYRARFDLTDSEAAGLKFLLIHSFSRDIVTVQVNGRLPVRTHPTDAYTASAHRNTGTSHSRIGPRDFDNRFDLTGLLKPGGNEIVFVYENIGHEHGYVPMEELCGIRAAGLGAAETSVSKPVPLEVATDLGGIANGWHLHSASTRDWKQLALDGTGKIPRKGNGIQPKGRADALLSWYRVEFELPAADPNIWIPWMLRVNASGNGEMYLNGHNIGRHFEAGPQREYFLPECWLNFGPGKMNVITLALRQTVNGATVRAAEIAPYPDSAEIRDGR